MAPGSVCGTGFSDRDEGTIGGERLSNPGLRLTKEEFIAKKKAELLERLLTSRRWNPTT